MAGNFGSTLREARERRGITLREIANATKISVSVLGALERNDISRLPGGIFGRAFVRSYAIEVGLDPEKTIQDFIAQFPHDSVTAGHPTTQQIEDNEAVESDRRAATTFLRLLGVSIPLAAAVLYFTTSGPLSPREPAATSPAAAAAAPRIERRAPRAAGSEPTPTDAAAAHPGSPRAEEPPGNALRVVLTATRSCWLSLAVDGEKPLQRLLQAGDRETLEVRRELVLRAGDAGAIAMTINGVGAKRLGKPGEVVTARVNLANFNSYLATP